MTNRNAKIISFKWVEHLEKEDFCVPEIYEIEKDIYNNIILENKDKIRNSINVCNIYYF